MGKKTTKETSNEYKEAKGSLSSFDAFSGWGDDTTSERTASGKKLKWTEDSEGILQFRNIEDISAFLDPKDIRDDKALYIKCWDGENIVSFPMGFALQKIQFKQDNWYYFYNQTLDTGNGLNEMNDLTVRFLGETGKKIKVPARIADSGSIELTDAVIRDINYNRINYPLKG